MSEGDEVTPHLSRSARHPLPKGEGCISNFVPRVQPKLKIESPESAATSPHSRVPNPDSPVPTPWSLETHPESPPGDCVREFLKEEFSGLLN